MDQTRRQAIIQAIKLLRSNVDALDRLIRVLLDDELDALFSCADSFVMGLTEIRLEVIEGPFVELSATPSGVQVSVIAHDNAHIADLEKLDAKGRKKLWEKAMRVLQGSLLREVH